jgi:transposase
MTSTRLSNPTIVKYIENWNLNGMKAIQAHRGGSESKLEPEIIDNIVYVVINKTPIDFGYTFHTWTCAVLVEYVKQTYGVTVWQQKLMKRSKKLLL